MPVWWVTTTTVVSASAVCSESISCFFLARSTGHLRPFDPPKPTAPTDRLHKGTRDPARDPSHPDGPVPEVRPAATPQPHSCLMPAGSNEPLKPEGTRSLGQENGLLGRFRQG